MHARAGPYLARKVSDAETCRASRPQQLFSDLAYCTVLTSACKYAPYAHQWLRLCAHALNCAAALLLKVLCSDTHISVIKKHGDGLLFQCILNSVEASFGCATPLRVQDWDWQHADLHHMHGTVSCSMSLAVAQGFSTAAKASSHNAQDLIAAIST